MSLNEQMASTLAWWHEAGVDTLVAERPREWLKLTEARLAPQVEAAPHPPDAAPYPGTLAEFRTWLLTSETMPGLTEERLDAEGDPASGLMILIDQSEAGDAEAGRLFCGEEGRLLDRMLAAIGRDRNSIYLATLSPARAATGRIDDALRERLAPAALHHVSLAVPRYLLVMGDAPTRAICAENLAEARGRLHEISYDRGRTIAIATFHPRFLLQRPAAKADSWKDLQMLLKGLQS